MGTFTALDPAQLAALATELSLGTLRESRAIAAGTINSNYLIETERGRFFVRINEGKSEADVAWEARLVAALADRGVTTPRPLPAHDGRPYAALAVAGETKYASAFAWRAGHHLHAEQVTAAHAQQLGRALAALHTAGLDLPVAWRRASIYDHAHLLARFARIERDAGADPHVAHDLAHALPILREELALAGEAAAVRAAATQGIIHGDLFRDNVLWDGAQLSAILDFEQASGGSLAYDLAVCINDWCWSEAQRAPRMDLAAALLAGYQAVRPLAAGDREALGIELRAAATRFTITRITDVYLARVDNPEKDFRAFLARVEVWRSQALHALTQLV